ncbi:hypothetical protein SNARM312S_03896 [Streptomyces narbonensis]
MVPGDRPLIRLPTLSGCSTSCPGGSRRVQGPDGRAGLCAGLPRDGMDPGRKALSASLTSPFPPAHFFPSPRQEHHGRPSLVRRPLPRPRHAPAPRLVRRLRRHRPLPERLLGLPPLPHRRRRGRLLRRPRLRRRRLERYRRPGPLGAPGQGGGVRRSRVHERPVPLPRRPAPRPHREPDRRPSAPLRPARRLAGGRRCRAPPRRGRVLRPGLAQRHGARRVQGLAAGPRVRRGAPPEGPGQRPRAPRPPVVLRLLPGGPGPVVAAGRVP